MVFQVGDLGADHASDHAAVGALLAGYIVTDLVLTLVLVLQSYSIKEALLLLRFWHLEAANRSCRSSLLLLPVMKTSYYYSEGCLVYTFIFIILLATRNRSTALFSSIPFNGPVTRVSDVEEDGKTLTTKFNFV